MNETAVIYARVSSVGDRQDTSRQIRDLEILAKEKSLKVVNTYEEHISGAKKTQDRPVLTECLNYCFSNHISVLLISELSRLGRNVDDVLSNVKLCKENHLNVYFQKEQLSIFNDDGGEHPFLMILIAALGTCAKLEREAIRFRMKSGYDKYRAEGGKVGRKKGYRMQLEDYDRKYPALMDDLRKKLSGRKAKRYRNASLAKRHNVNVSTVQSAAKMLIGNTG